MTEKMRENTKPTRPLLTIIVAAYNCEAYLEEGLHSILDQMTPEHELILVDDGSSDGTRELLAKYEGRQDNLHVHYGSHRGASGARNLGLANARGKYVAFMDCDDCLQEGFLAESMPLLSTDPALCIFGIERIFLSGESECWKVADRTYKSVSEFADDYIRTRRLLIYSNCNKFYRRRIIEEGTDGPIRFEEGTAFGEDRLFNYRYLTECGRQGAGAPGGATDGTTDETTGRAPDGAPEGAAGNEVITSSMVMLRYLQRSEESMSTKTALQSEEQLMRLHQEKMDCFLGLSRGTTEQERQDFIAYDLKKEKENAGKA